MRYWSDSVTLWTHTLQVIHRNWVAELSLGILFQQQGQLEEALPHFYHAAEDKPENSHVNLGIAVVEHERGNLRQAIRYYEKVLAVSDDEKERAQAWANMGHAYSDLGDNARARECYEAALRPRPLQPRSGINWQGDWWRDLGPFISQRFREWRSGDKSAPQSR